MDQALTDVEIRRELGDILDKLSTLPLDDYAARSALLARQDHLRAALSSVETDNAAEIRQRWAELAGSKPGEEDQPVIPSPGEGGGAGWGGI